MPFLLMVFLTLVCLPDPSDWPEPIWPGATPLTSVLWTALALVLPIIYAGRLSHEVASTLRREPFLRSDAFRRFERGRFRQQLLLFGLYCLALRILGWGWAVTRFWSSQGQLLPGAEILILTPFLLSLVLSWLAFYRADRAAFLSAHHLYGFDSIETALSPDRHEEASASPDFGGPLQYIAFQVRQKLALVAIPLTLLLGQKELQRQFPDLWRDWQWVVNFASFGLVMLVFATMPLIVRAVLGLRPLPASPTRDRLVAAARRLGFRCSDILLWQTHGAMANAMVVGILPWLRYIVFTDKLLEEFTEDEVEAVLGHEVGHIKHHHMLYYFTFLGGSMVALGILVTEYLPELVRTATGKLIGADLNGASLSETLGEHPYLHAVPLVGCFVAYLLVVFGFLSRRCERQADINGCRAVSCGRSDCPPQHGEAAATAGGNLCPVGIRIFIHALEKVAVVNGISRDHPGFLHSWQHSSIGRRVEFLQRILTDPALEPRFQRRVAFVKWGLFLALGVVLLFLLGGNGWTV